MRRGVDRTFIQAFKTATALSIIRSKPPDTTLTTFEYTEQICFNYKKSQHFWKTKYRKAEEEILNLRQQIILSKNSAHADENLMVSSTLNVPDISVPVCSDPIFPTPPLSHESKATTKSIFFHNNTTYLQSIIRIRQTLKDNDKEAIQPTTKETIISNLQILQEMLFKDDLHISQHNLMESMKCVIELSSIFYGTDYKEINTNILNIVEGLVSKLLQVDGIDKASMGAKENIQKLIIIFADSKHLTYWAFTINILMSHCEQFCNKLRKAQEQYQALTCMDYENIIYIIESIVIGLKCNSEFLCSSEGNNLCSSVQLHVDKSLLHISDKYPLVTHSLWKISGILQKYLQ